jgi:PAS domain S-box-containing protein
MRRLLHFMDWPLRLKLAVLLVVASIVPLGIATFIDIRGTRERLVANTANLLAARADHLADRIDTFHSGYEHSAGRISRLPNAAALCQARGADNDRLKSDLRAVLDVWPASDSNIRGVAIVDLTGTVRAATEDPLIGLDLSYHRYVQEARRGVAFTSDIYFAEPQVGGAATIAYVDPVLDADKQPVGFAVLWVHANALWDVMKASNELAGSKSFAVLFDHQGIRIGHTYSDEIVFHPGGQLDPATVNALVAERRFGDNTRQLLEDVRAFPQQFERALAKSPDEAMFRGVAPVNQKWNYGVARRFKTVPWTVFYMIPEESLNAQIAKMTRQKTLFAGVIILIALLAGTFLAAVILKPISSLSATTELIASGDLAARVRPGHADELGRLGTSFNAMAEQIEAQATALLKVRDELERRVQERTAELVQKSKDLEIQIIERERLAAIAESSDDAIISKDLQGIIATWNSAAETMFGYSRQEMVGKPMTQIIPPDRVDEEPRILAQIVRGEIVDHFETVRIGKDGNSIEVSVTISPIKDRDGRITGASNIARDITERKRAEEALRASEDQFRIMANSIPQLAWVANADGFVFWYNQRWHDYTGKTLQDMEGWGWQSVHDPKMLPQVLEKWQDAIATGQPFEMEFPLRGADGRFRMFLTRVQPLKDSQGRVVQWFGTNTDVDELKRVEESLRDTQARLNSTLAAGSIGTWTWDIVNDCLAADEFTARMFSIDADAAAKGLPAAAYLKVISEEELPAVEAALARAIQSCGHYDIEYRVRQKDGGFRWLQARGRVEGDAAGNAVSFHGAVMDITERKQAESALRASEERLRIVTDNARVGLVMVDGDRRYTFANSTYIEILGLPPTDIVGQRLADVLGPVYEAQIRPRLDRAFAGERVFYELQRPTSEADRFYAVTYEPTKIGGAVSLVVVVITDITERKQAEDARRKSDARYRTLFENAPDGIVVADRDSYYIDANASICRMLGYSREELIGLHASDIVTETEIQHIAPALSVIKTKSDYHREWEFRRKDGSQFPAEVIATMMPDGNLLGMIRDITERQQAEKELRRLYEELEQRVADRTAQLQAVNKELEAFSYSVSHDLRAPLRHINGFSQALLEDYGDNLDETGKGFLQEVRSASQEMAQLIDDVLQLARVTRSEMRQEVINLSELARATVARLQERDTGRTVAVKVEAGLFARGDKRLLQVMLNNLLGNAWKFTSKRAEAEISFGQTKIVDEFAYFVSDNGAGFDMAYTAKLFGAFQRLHTANEFEGTGIGLATVQRIINRHGGRVWAESAVDQGATFYFTLANLKETEDGEQSDSTS